MTAFSRQRQQPRRADVQELAELDAAEAALESGSEGDLEDDFLLTATQVPHRCIGAPGMSHCFRTLIAAVSQPLLHMLMKE